MSLVKTVKIWRCDVCGKEAPWSEGWRTKLIMHKKGQWDEEVQVCSTECAEKFDAKRRSK